LIKRFRIGNIGLSISIEDEERFQQLGPAYRPFEEVVSALPTAPDITIRACTGPLPQLGKSSSVLYDCERFWTAHELSNKLVFACRTADSARRNFRVALGNRARTEWELITNSRAECAENAALAPDVLASPAAELVLNSYVATRAGCLVHACSVADEGRGYLFCGPARAGKSTTARIWSEHARVLNDDRTLLRREPDGSLTIYGTPWHGDFARTSSKGVPLTAIFVLEPATEPHIQPLSALHAHPLLLTSFCLPHWDRAQALPQALGLCQYTVQQVPTFRLKFTPNESVIDLVRRAVL
jgi:hypothetical protein